MIPQCFIQRIPDIQRIIQTKGPEEVFQKQGIYCVSNIMNGVRVYRGGETTYIEYSLKGVTCEYAIKLLQ